MVDVMSYHYSIVNYRGKEIRNVRVISTNKVDADSKLLLYSTNMVSKIITPKYIRFKDVDYLIPYFYPVEE